MGLREKFFSVTEKTMNFGENNAGKKTGTN